MNEKLCCLNIAERNYCDCLNFSNKLLDRHRKDKRAAKELQVTYEGGRFMTGTRSFCYISHAFMIARSEENHLLRTPFTINREYPFIDAAYIEMTAQSAGFARIMDEDGKCLAEGPRLKQVPEFQGEELLGQFYDTGAQSFKESVATFKSGSALWELFGKGRRPGVKARFEIEIGEGSNTVLISHPGSPLPSPVWLREDAKPKALKWVLPACQFHDLARALKDYKRQAPVIELGEHFARIRTTEDETIMICACRQ